MPPTPKHPLLTPGAPFVLLDDAGPDGGEGARLYRDAVEIVVARRPGEVAPALARIDALVAEGRTLAGYLAYEAALALEPRLAPLAEGRICADGPLVWFGAFAECQRLGAGEVAAWLAENRRGEGAASIGPLDPCLSPGGYARAFAALHAGIVAGDIYQANLTFPLAGSWRGDPLALYAALRARGGGRHAAADEGHAPTGRHRAGG